MLLVCAATLFINSFGAGTNVVASAEEVSGAEFSTAGGATFEGATFKEATLEGPALAARVSAAASGSSTFVLVGMARAAASCSSRLTSWSMASSVSLVGVCSVPEGCISSSCGVTEGARMTWGVTAITMSV